jgi:hypothetical protein
MEVQAHMSRAIWHDYDCRATKQEEVPWALQGGHEAWCMVPMGRLIHIVCAQWATVHARTITRSHSVSQRHRERIHAPSIDDAMMAVRKKFKAIT